MSVKRVVPDFQAQDPAASSEFYAEVLGLEVAMDLGCEILHPLTDEPWGVRRFFVRDPSGKVLNILSHP